MRTLFIIHPGSACGSAEFNIGAKAARNGRGELIDEMAQWRGPVIIIDSDLSDELGCYPVYASAIDACIDRNMDMGTLRLEGYDDAGSALQRPDVLAMTEGMTEGVVTGAWREDCVRDFARALESVRPQAIVSVSCRSLSIDGCGRS